MGKLASRLVGAGRLTRAELTSTAACAFTFTAWNAAARGLVTLDAPLVFTLLCLACVLAGRVCVRVLGPDEARDFPTVFVFGFLALSSALYLLAWVSPLPIVGNGLLLLAAVLALQVLRPAPEPADDARLGPGTLTVAVCLIAATFWSRDSIDPQFVFREGVMVKPWVDSHFHACEIRMFRDARGFATLEDIRMAGQPVWVYHHASYIVAALVSAATGTSAYLAFGSFLVPAGVVLAGLAAYAMVRSLWGSEAGLAAAATLLLLPDASWHGLANPCLSYHWLQQIAPAGLYGVAVLATAWLLMFAGCRTGRLALVGLSFLTASLAAHFKAHLFVAAALLIWLYPGVWLRGVGWRWKAAWLVLGLAVFAMVADRSQQIEAVPTLRLDGSALKTYANRIVSLLHYASSRHYFARFTPESSLAHDAYWGSVLLFYGTVGLCGVANVALAAVVLVLRVLRRPASVTLEQAAFPILIIVNYLVMALGLALDQNSPGQPDELLHRPLVWAYFVSAAWAGGMAYRLFLEGPVQHSPNRRAVLAAGVLALLIVPLRMGPNIQVGPAWGYQLTWQSYPRGLIECARYIQVNAGPGDIVQESRNDPIFVLGAACEHPAYAIDYGNGKKSEVVLSRRLKELEAFRDLTDAESIRRFAGARRIRWYVLRPETRVRWPASVLAEPAFSWNGFRVFAFQTLPTPKPARAEQTDQISGGKGSSSGLNRG